MDERMDQPVQNPSDQNAAARRRAWKARKMPKSILVLIFFAVVIILTLLYLTLSHFGRCDTQKISIDSPEIVIPRNHLQKPSVDSESKDIDTSGSPVLLQIDESVTNKEPDSFSTLVLYELYYADSGWSSLHDSEPYQPLCVNPNMTRPNSTDIDAPAHLPVLTDSTYQGLICEYGAIFAVRKRLPDFQKGANWVGFQSWRAAQKERALSPKALQSMAADMRRRDESGHTDVMYFWSEYGPKSMLDVCDG